MANTFARPVHGDVRLRMSYDEYVASVDDSVHSEWVDGEVTIFMPPSTLHQRIVRFLTRLISDYADERQLGELFVSPFEMRLPGGRSYRQPDLLFVRADRLSLVQDLRLDGAADLVIEIVSPESAQRDRREKFVEYQEAGIPEYWIIDLREELPRVSFFTLDSSGRYVESGAVSKDRLHSGVLPGLWIEPAWFRQEPLPNHRSLLRVIAPELFA